LKYQQLTNKYALMFRHPQPYHVFLYHYRNTYTFLWRTPSAVHTQKNRQMSLRADRGIREIHWEYGE
jgi:hypothetical protein